MEPVLFPLLDNEAIPAGAIGKRILFSITRSRFDQEHPVSRGLTGVQVRSLFPAVEVRWKDVTDPGNARVQVPLFGEEPSVVDPFWLFPPTIVLARPMDRSVPEVGFTAAGVEALAQVRAAYLDRSVALRREYIQEIPDPTKRRYHQFFFDLDHGTHPSILMDAAQLGTEPVIVEAVRRVGRLLQERVEARVKAHRGHPPCLKPVRGDDLEQLSWLQRPMYETHFSTLTGHLDLREAFEAFAGGRWYTGSQGAWDMGPQSTWFLAFAEFTIACIEADIDQHFWRAVLPVHVMTQEVYERACPAGGTARGWSRFIKPVWRKVAPAFLERLSRSQLKVMAPGLCGLAGDLHFCNRL